MLCEGLTIWPKSAYPVAIMSRRKVESLPQRCNRASPPCAPSAHTKQTSETSHRRGSRAHFRSAAPLHSHNAIARITNATIKTIKVNRQIRARTAMAGTIPKASRNRITIGLIGRAATGCQTNIGKTNMSGRTREAASELFEPPSRKAAEPAKPGQDMIVPLSLPDPMIEAIGP
jgi:hypothetical protein